MRTARWTAPVIERIGEAPASIGAACTITLERSPPGAPHDPGDCEVTVACNGRAVYPAPGETGRATCSHRFGHGFTIVDGGTNVRVYSVGGVVRVDDGPVGTWSFAF